MDKNGARGRAHSITAHLLNNLELTDVPAGDLALLKQELERLANEHVRIAALHKAIEQGTIDRRIIAHNYMNDPLTLDISEEGEGLYIVTWEGLCGYSMVKMFCPSAVEADKLFEALQGVGGTEED